MRADCPKGKLEFDPWDSNNYSKTRSQGAFHLSELTRQTIPSKLFSRSVKS